MKNLIDTNLNNQISQNQAEKKYLNQRAFTIVELILVIVVIGILSIIALVSYIGVNNRAATASMQSDLTNGSNQLKLYFIQHSSYPTSMSFDGKNTYCPNPVDSNFCIKTSPGNSLVYTPGGGGTPQTFTLDATNVNTVTYRITENTIAALYVAGGGKTWLQISAGSDHTCGILSDHNAYCWGDNASGQLGNNSLINSPVPVPVNTSGVLSGKTITAISAGAYVTCAIASDSNAYCWGMGTGGVLGNGASSQSKVPVAVSTAGALSGKTVKSISVGSDWAVCAIASDNKPYCWGQNTSAGALGNNSAISSNIPVAVLTTGVLSGKTVSSISSGFASACVVASDTYLYCWGGSFGGRVPILTDGSGEKAVSTSPYGGADACWIGLDDYPYCYGSDSPSGGGALGGKTIKSITVGSDLTNPDHICVIASDNNAYCWGDNTNGDFGNGTAGSGSLAPHAVDTNGVLSGKTVSSISSGGATCVIASDGQAYCWGLDDMGELGNNTTGTNSNVPVAVTVP
ncbi:MAG: prepilin-type N-terminal cleavage/methylation domain-containing protein [Candidatus Saccharibacteria bacterium]|nr:prepilin-type N-terminal cleavage/methylation domain-containing protein [Candidatus Saccharibacteria bacterium]